MREGALVYVKWVDPSSTAKWLEKDEAKGRTPMHCETVGFFLNRDRDVIRICCSRSEEGRVADVFVIPRGCVKEIRELEFKEGKV